MTSRNDDETRVDITIMAPPHFLSRHAGTVYFNLARKTELVVEGDFNITAYGMYALI